MSLIVRSTFSHYFNDIEFPRNVCGINFIQNFVCLLVFLLFMHWSIWSFPPTPSPFSSEEIGLFKVPPSGQNLCSNAQPKCWIWWLYFLKKENSATIMMAFYKLTKLDRVDLFFWAIPSHLPFNRCNTCILLERLDTSGSNYLSRPGTMVKCP